MPSFVNGETRFPNLFRGYLEAQRSNVGLPVSATLPFDAWQGALIGIASGLASSDVITTLGAHGLNVADPVLFPTLTGGTGLTSITGRYFVQSVPSLTTLKVSATSGGSALDFTTNITAGEIRVLRELKRPYVGFQCIGYQAPHPLLQRLQIECALHVNTDATAASDENNWIATIRAALSDDAALFAWLNALTLAERTGWCFNGYLMAEGETEFNSKTKLRIRRAILNVRCQSSETAGF